MAKKRTKKADIDWSNDVDFDAFEAASGKEEYMVPSADLEYVAEVMTYFVYAINPMIDKGITYEIMLTVMTDGLDAKTAKKYGELIRQSSLTPRSTKNGDTLN